METFKAVGEVDYDPFADEPAAAEPATSVGTSAKPAPASPTEEEAKPDYVIPSRSSFKIPKVVRQDDLDREKNQPKGPVFTAGKEVDFDPFEEGFGVREAAKGVASGAGVTIGSVLAGTGEARQEAIGARKQEEAAEAARAKVLKEEGLDTLTRLDTLPPEKQARVRRRLEEATKSIPDATATLLERIKSDPFYKAGLATKDWSEETFKAAHDYEDSWTREIAEGFGSTIPHIAVNFVPVVGQGVSLAAGYTSSIDEAFQRAVQGGATPEQLKQVLKIGGLPGLTEQLPMEVLFERVPLPVVGKLAGAVIRVGSKVLAEGGQEAFQQWAQNVIAKYVYKPDQDLTEGVLEAGVIGGVVGGGAAVPGEVLRKSDDGKGKADDQPDTAAPAQPEGTPAAPAPAAGQATPGSTGTVAPPPAGVENQPEPAKPGAPVAGTDPRTDVKPPQPAPLLPAQPGVTVVQPGAPAPDVGAAIGTTPAAGAGPANVPGGTAPVDEVDEGLTEEPTLPETDEDAAAARAKARWAPIIAEQQKATAAQQKMLDEQKRAKQAEQTLVAPAGSAEQAALAATVPPQPAPTPTLPTAASPQQETLGTGRALGQPAAEPAATVPTPPVAPAPTPQADVSRQAPPPETLQAPLPQAPAPAPQPELIAAEPAAESVPQPELVPAQPVAAFQVVREVQHDPFAGEPTREQILAEAEAGTPMAARWAERLGGRAAVAEPTAEPTPAAVTKPKVEVLKKKARVKKPTEKPAERVEPKEAPAQPAAAEPAPAPAARPPRSPMVRDIANDARTSIRHGKSMVSEVEGFNATVDEVTDEVVAENPRSKDQSPREYMDTVRDKIVALVHERLTPKLAEVEKEKERIAESATPEGRARLVEAERVEKMAAATKPQQKERAGKGGEKSATGIRAESEQSTRDAVKRNAALPEAERSPHLTEWDRLSKLRARTKGADAKAEITKQMQAQQELRAQAVEARATSKELSPRAKQAEKDVLAALPKPPPRPAAGYVRSLHAALKGIELHSHHDSTHQSPAENFAIWVRGIISKTGSRKVSDEDQLEVWIGQQLLENGQTADLNNMMTTETLQGLGQQGDAADTIAMTVEAAEEVTGEGEEELRRGGARGARERNAAWQAREEAAYKDFRPMQVTKPDGSTVTVLAETRKARSVLREVNRLGKNQGGFIGMLNSMLVHRLNALVGDVDVHFVTPTAMAELGKSGAAGLHYNYSAEMRAAGFRPQVFISTEETFNPQNYVHTALHELTHAATSQAINDNLRGTDQILTSMRRALISQFGKEQLAAAGFTHAFRSNNEFIAEAFSNPRLQRLLAEAVVPADVRAQIQGITPNRAPTWWDAFVAAVSNAIGIIRGTRGQTFMEQIVKLEPTLFRSEIVQQRMAREQVLNRPQLSAARPKVGTDPEALIREIGNLTQPIKSKLRFGAGDSHWRDALSTTGAIMRDSERTFGGVNNVLQKFGKLVLRKDEIFKEKRLIPVEGVNNKEIEEKVATFTQKHEAEAARAGVWYNRATAHQLDPRVGLSNPANAHISKKGLRGAQARAVHKELHEEWNKLSAEAKSVINDLAAHYKKLGEAESDGIVRSALNNAMDRYETTLPAGKTIDDAIAWVKDGGAARKEDERTADDKVWRAALGKTADSLANVKELSRLKGIYGPLTRKGKFFLTARQKVFDPNNLPPGADVESDNQLVFTDGKQATAFTEKHPGYTRMTFRHLDPKTGKRVPASFAEKDPTVPGGVRTAVKEYIVTIQDKLLEMSDNEQQLQDRRHELHTEGWEVGEVLLSAKHYQQAVREISSREVQSLLNNINQTTVGQTPIGQQALHDAILDLHVRQLVSPGHLQHRLKRRNVQGASIDLSENLRAYNKSFAHHAANLELQHEISKADTAVTDFIKNNGGTYQKDSRVGQDRQSQHQELRDRIRQEPSSNNETGLEKASTALRNVAAIKHLGSIHYNIMQNIQFYTGSIPVLFRDYGLGAAIGALHRGHAIGGGWRGTYKKAGVEVGRSAKNLISGRHENQDIGAMWREGLKGHQYERELTELFKEVDGTGLGVTNSVEAPSAAELDMSRAERVLSRSTNLAMAPSRAFEASNRYSVAAAAYELARRSGMSHEDAKMRSLLTVEEAQGGYGAGNNPSIFRNPLAAAALQFRKYGLNYAGTYYRALYRSMAGATPAEKRAARRQLLAMTVTSAIFAGVYGTAGMELVRMFTLLAMVFGKEDDPEKDENDVQEWLADMIAWATGSRPLGDLLSEGALRGPTRWLQIDTSNALGNDSNIIFGQPKSMDVTGVTAWLGQMLIGATGGMVIDIGKKIYNADEPLDWLEVPPWPKLIGGMIDASRKAADGYRNPQTGEQYAGPLPTWDAVVKMIGFRPVSEARTWEAGGEAAVKKEIKREWHDRSDLMAKYRAAGSPAAKRAFFRSEIRAWNRAHRDPKEKIEYGDLLRSERSKKQRQKELEEAMEAH